MLFTREEGWKEMKAGRIFSDTNCISIQENRKEITQSQYVCHLGEHRDFLTKLEYYAEGYDRKICIVRLRWRAKWIWNWAEDTSRRCFKY